MYENTFSMPSNVVTYNAWQASVIISIQLIIDVMKNAFASLFESQYCFIIALLMP